MRLLHPFLHRSSLFSKIPNTILSAILLVILPSLNRCDTEPESMHWLQFRGPNASGIAPENADPPIHFSADTNLLWKTEILPGWSSPCIVNDRIFLTGFNKEDSLLCTFAIDRENGTMLWSDPVAPDTLYRLHSINSYVNPTIASDGKRIFSHYPCHGLLAYELDGTKVWEYLHPTPLNSMHGGFSPVIRDSLVIFDVSLWPNPRIQVHHCRTGDSLWVLQDSLHYFTNATPVFHGNLLIMHKYNHLVGYNLENRNVEWWLKTPTTASSTPLIYNDLVVAGTWSNFGERSQRGTEYTFGELLGFYDRDRNRKLEQGEIPDSVMVFVRPESREMEGTSIRLNEDRMFGWYDDNEDGAFDKNDWDIIRTDFESLFKDHGILALRMTGKGELSDSMVIWKYTKDTPEVPSPLPVGENVFFIKNGGIMTVINVASGEMVKKGRIGAAGAYISSPMLAGNRIYTCSYNGKITVLSADDFSVLAHNRLGEKIGASPVAVDDVLYVRTDKHLYAFRDM